MSNSRDFRLRLAGRVAALIALSTTSAAVGTLSSGCFTTTSCGDDSSGTYEATQCFTWPEVDGGSSSSSGAGGMGGAGGAGGSGGGAMPVACPAPQDAKSHMSGGIVLSVNGPGTASNGECCYPVTEQSICEGRPFIVQNTARTAELAPSPLPNAWNDSTIKPDLSDLSPEERAILSSMWRRAALMEHASVASFGRFALELLAAGAPSDLVEDAHRAALDEVKHARLCFALAGAYAGETVAPGLFALGNAVEVASDLADIAVRTWNEGCVGETLSACIAVEQLAKAEDPAVRAVLSALAEEESRHAELAFRTVAWAIRVGGDRVRAALADAVARMDFAAKNRSEANENPRLCAHGKLLGAEVRAATEQALRDIVLPAARMLLRPRVEAQAVQLNETA